MEKKFVNIRLESISLKKAITELRHDTRKTTPPHRIQKDQPHNQYKNQYSNYDHALNQLNHFMDLHDELSVKYQGRKVRRERTNTFMRGIVTLSPYIKEMLMHNEVTRDELNSMFKHSMNDIITHIRSVANLEHMEVISFDIHFDEETPHAHFMIQNFSNDALTILHQLKDKNQKHLSLIQDIGAQAFEKIGFTRGISKEISGAKHQKIMDINDLDKEMLDKKQQFQLVTHTITTQIKQHQSEIKRLQDYKNQQITAIDDINTRKAEYEKINTEIREMKNNIKELKDEKKQLTASIDIYAAKSDDEIKKKVKQTLGSIIQKYTSKNLLGTKIDYHEAYAEVANLYFSAEKNLAKQQRTINNQKVQIDANDTKISQIKNSHEEVKSALHDSHAQETETLKQQNKQYRRKINHQNKIIGYLSTKYHTTIEDIKKEMENAPLDIPAIANNKFFNESINLKNKGD